MKCEAGDWLGPTSLAFREHHCKPASIAALSCTLGTSCPRFILSKARRIDNFGSAVVMAAASRTTMLRQTQLLSSTTRLFSTTAQPLRLRSAPSVPSPRQLLAPRWSAASRLAPFSTTSQRNILPAGPHVIEGGVNDPAPVPKPNPLHGSYHWTFERAISVALVPLTITPFAVGSMSPAIDAALIFSLIVHSHMGFQ